MMTKKRALHVLSWWAMLSAGASALGQPLLRPTIPEEPIAAIVEAFKTHDVVALGEGPHGNLQGHAFRLALVRDPRFSSVADDIVVEFGTARHQGIMDAFIAGESVHPRDLRRAWQDTTVVTPVWDRPIYEEFFRAVRDVNRLSPKDRRLRVLLGDAPIDWSTTKTREDVRQWGIQKGRHTADVIRREVLGKGRKALVVYGDSWFQGRRIPDDRLPINILEGAPTRARVFAIATAFQTLTKIQEDVRRWPVPSIAAIRGTVIGARPLAQFYPIPPAEGWDRLTMEDTYDAILYLGDVPPAMSQLDPKQCADTDYMQMRLARMALDLEQVRQVRIDALKQYCASVAALP